MIVLDSGRIAETELLDSDRRVLGSLSLIARRRRRAPGRRLPHTGNAPSAPTRPHPRRLAGDQGDIRQAH